VSNDPFSRFIGIARLAGRLSPEAKVSGRIDFVLYHVHNKEFKQALEEIVGSIEYSRKLIGFSGGSGKDVSDLNVPILANVTDVVTDLRWGRVPTDFNGNAQELAELLAPTVVGLDIASALLILCQGYLAVHAEKCSSQGSAWGPSEITGALVQMGWNDEVHRLCDTNLASKRPLVQNPAWWKGPLEPNGVDEVVARLCQELPALDLDNDTSPVMRFLNRIFAEQEEIRELAEVAEVYKVLADCAFARSTG
jgi:hypothetical protein